MRLGKIKISDSFIRNDRIMDLLPMFTKAVPIHIEGRPHHRDYVYTCVCDDFSDISEGVSIPFYTCTVEPDKVRFNKE